jgi:hypothetical protein
MRTDLLELTIPILTELTNAGLVKRAQREVEQGLFAEPVIDGENVTVSASDGNTIVFAPGSGLGGMCTCGAATCRHRIGAVLRYQQWNATNATPILSTPKLSTESTGDATSSKDATPPGIPLGSRAPTADKTLDQTFATSTDSDPTAETQGLPVISDELLAKVIPPRTLATAKRRRSEGYLASVIAAFEDDPCIVELGSVSVRFLLGADLRYSRCNCKLRSGCEHIVLAAWAIQEAQKREKTQTTIVTVGGPEGFGSATINDELSGLSVQEAVFALVGLVLTDGAAHLSPAFAVRVAAVRRLSERTRQQWISVLLDQLVELQIAIDQRASVDIGRLTGNVLAGLVARYRAAAAFDGRFRIVNKTNTTSETEKEEGSTASNEANEYSGPPSAIVLGTDERAETPLTQIRLTGAGARVRAGTVAGSCVVEVLLVDPTTSMMVTCQRLFRPTDRSLAGAVPTIGASADIVEQTGPLVANRTIVKGAAVRTMASGGIVTNAAVRRADRTIEFRVGGLRQTSVTSGGAGASRFRDAGIVTEPSMVLATQANELPALLAPLIATHGIAAFEIEHCGSAFFDPAQQMVVCQATTIGGETVLLRSTYSDLTPGAPAALALFAAHTGAGTVVGHVSLEGSVVFVDPAFLGMVSTNTNDDAVLIPHLYEPDKAGNTALAALPTTHLQSDDSAIHQAIREALSVVDEVALRGIRNAGGIDRQLTSTATSLQRAGLTSLAKRITELATAVRAATIGGTESATNQWAEAAIALRIAASLPVEDV